MPGVAITGVGVVALLIAGLVFAIVVRRRSDLSGGVSSIEPADLAARIARGERLQILDVRSEAEFAAGHVPGAVNIPFNHVSSRLAQVPTNLDEPLYVYCGHGPRAYIAASALRHGGRSRLIYVKGHFAAWLRAGLPVLK